jgi:polysaccharide pyruvyl transferase WcaK-like protein
MKIMIVSYWGDANRGEAAMIQATIASFKKIYPNSSFTIIPCFSSKDPAFSNSTRNTTNVFPEIKTVSPLITAPHNYWIQKHYTGLVCDLITTFWWAYKFLVSNLTVFFKLYKNHPFWKELQECDFVLSCPGEHFFSTRHGIFSVMDLWGHFYSDSLPLLMAYRSNKPFILFCQSTTSFSHTIVKYSLKKLLSKASFILTRDEYTLKELLRCGISSHILRLGADPSFGIIPANNMETINNILAKYQVKNEEYCVLNVSYLMQENVEQYHAYIRAVSGTIDEIIKQGIIKKVIIIPNSLWLLPRDNDLKASKDLISEIKNNGNISLLTEDISPAAICSIMSKAKFCIGSRYHSIAFALNAGTPVIGINRYSYKTKWLMRYFGLESYLVDIHNISTPILVSLIKKLVSETKIIIPEIENKVKTIRRRLDELPQEVILHIDENK